MVMTYQLKGKIDDDGQLHIRLPDGFSAGDVDVIVTLDAPVDVESEADIQRYLTPKPARSGAEIAEFLRSDAWDSTLWENISDPVEWLEKQRATIKSDRWTRDE